MRLNYIKLNKFGYGKVTDHVSREIRLGKITRDEAVYLVKKYDSEFPKKYFKEFLEYIDTSESKFIQIIDEFRSPHLWTKENGDWKLKHTCYN